MDVTRGEDSTSTSVGIMGVKEKEGGHQPLGWKLSPPLKKRLRFDGNDYVREAGKEMQEFLDQFPNTSYSTSKSQDVNIRKEALHYSNGICFLSDEHFDDMVTAKHAAEEAIGWKVLPENIVYRVKKLVLSRPSGDLDVLFT